MSVKAALDKIVERHPDVIGAMVLHDNKVAHNLEAPYDVVDIATVMEMLAEIFEQTSILADEGYEFGELMLDFSNHSFIARTIDGGLLAVLAPAMQRGQLVKLHVGLGIFGKAVQKALAEQGICAELSPTPGSDVIAPSPMAETEPVRIVSQPLSEPVSDEPTEAPEAQNGGIFGFGKKRRGGFRGTKELLASRVQEAIDATSEPQPKEPEVNADGVPLNPDGTPKKKRIYRGQVFYE
ncbi:MAG: hypothetical protein AAFY31_12855 [Pseudomonadota bacterium]